MEFGILEEGGLMEHYRLKGFLFCMALVLVFDLVLYFELTYLAPLFTK
jgi:hypothetical protein